MTAPYPPAAQAADDQEYADVARNMHAVLPEVLKVYDAHGAVAAASCIAAEMHADPPKSIAEVRTIAGVAMVELSLATRRIARPAAADAHEAADTFDRLAANARQWATIRDVNSPERIAGIAKWHAYRHAARLMRERAARPGGTR